MEPLMLARPRALLALASLALSVLAARPAAASQSLECKLGGSGLLSCWDGKLTLRAADLSESNLVAAASPGAREVFVNYAHACAPTPDGALDCWGDNESGELGDGTRVHRDRPVRVRGLGDVTAVALGGSMSCALQRSGKVACWGYDDVTRTHRLRPTVVPALDHVVELVADGGHACARRKDDSVWCWGDNHYGQLGDGTRKDRGRPVQVAGLTGAVELAAGSFHTCARRQDGSIWCWGNGAGGEDGAEDRLLSAAKVVAIRGATALVTTGDGFLVQQKDGRLMACGYDITGRSEASPRILCRGASAPKAKLLVGTQIAIHRSSSRRAAQDLPGGVQRQR